LSKSEIDALKKLVGGFDNHIYGSGKDGNDEEGEDSNGSVESNSDRISLDRIQKWKKIVAEGLEIAKQKGNIPSGLERMIEGILDSKINWKEKLYKYVIAQIPSDYSYLKPNKRTAYMNIYLPSILKESVHIVVSVDTSGSIGNGELKEFLSELLAIVESFPNVNMDIIVADCVVHETYKLSQTSMEEILSLKMSGGGGTDHKIVLDHIKENIDDARVLLAFTDGYTNFGEMPEGFNVLWVISKHGVAESSVPYGEVIKLE
jgi:predicted metal-dependent peptidase